MKKLEAVAIHTISLSGTHVGKDTSVRWCDQLVEWRQGVPAAREADLAKLKVEQLKEKVQIDAKIAAQKAKLDAQLTIKEAKQDAD